MDSIAMYDLGEETLNTYGLSKEVRAEYERIVEKSLANDDLTQREVTMLFFYLRHRSNKNFAFLNKKFDKYEAKPKKRQAKHKVTKAKTKTKKKVVTTNEK